MHESGFPYLAVMLAIPMASALILAFLSGGRWHFRATTLNVAIVMLILAIPMMLSFERQATGVSFAFSGAELARGWSFSLGVDGASFPLVLLAVFLLPVSVLASWKEVGERVRRFHILVLLATASALGVYVAWDVGMLSLFWVAHQCVVVMLLYGFGDDTRHRKALAALFMTGLQLFCLLVGVFTLHRSTGSLSMDTLSQGLPLFTQLVIFISFALAAILGAAFFPCHVWMTTARESSSSAGSLFLSSSTTVIGVYVLYRLCLGLTPNAAESISSAMVMLSGAGILYCGLSALSQDNIYRMLASVTGCVTSLMILGLFLLNGQGVKGALYLNMHHAVAMAGLVFLFRLLHERTGIHSGKGLVGRVGGMPVLLAMTGVFVFALAYLPGLSGFVGLVLILGGAFTKAGWTGWLALPGSILLAMSLVRPYMKMVCSPASPSDKGGAHRDVRFTEAVYLVPLLAFMLWLGLAQGLVLNMMETSISGSPAVQTVILAGSRDAAADPAQDQ